MAETVSLSVTMIIDWSIIVIATIVIIGVIEEPVDDALFAVVDTFETRDSNDALSSDEGQPKEVVAEFLAKPGDPDPEPEFAEPDQRRRRRRSRGRGGYGVALAVALIMAMSVGESFEGAPEEAANSTKRVCRNRNKSATFERIDIEHSAVERVPIPDQVV